MRSQGPILEYSVALAKGSRKERGTLKFRRAERGREMGRGRGGAGGEGGTERGQLWGKEEVGSGPACRQARWATSSAAEASGPWVEPSQRGRGWSMLGLPREEPRPFPSATSVATSGIWGN